MNNPLMLAQDILIDLENELIKLRNFWLQVRHDNPHLEQVSEENWREKSSRCWLHGGTKLLETNELERWLFNKMEPPQLAQKGASRFIASWKKRMNEKGGPWGHYYADDPRFTLKAKKDEALIGFLIRMAGITEEFGKGERLAWRALKSFLCFLRVTHLGEEIAFVDHIFPEKMDVSHGRIIRKIPSEVYPIPEQTAGDILSALAIQCRESRPDAQHGLLETFGLCWLCLTASRLRLPTQVEMIYETKISAVNLEGEFPIIRIPTHFGPQPIQISHRVANFLCLLSQAPSEKYRETILQKPLRSLNRAFDRVLGKIRLDPTFGNITFLTLLGPPHIFGENHRYLPK